MSVEYDIGLGGLSLAAVILAVAFSGYGCEMERTQAAKTKMLQECWNRLEVTPAKSPLPVRDEMLPPWCKVAP